MSKGTASASELLINNLKPYVNARLIGSGSTHGKPVGFFPIPLSDYYLFPVSFKSVNKNGEGNYYNGLSVNAQIADGLDSDWGSLNESSLAAAIRHITTGAYSRELPYLESEETRKGNEILETPFLKIAVTN